MDDTARETEPTVSRRAFFGRALALTGGAAVVLTLTGCPGGNGGDDDDEGDDGDDD